MDDEKNIANNFNNDRLFCMSIEKHLKFAMGNIYYPSVVFHRKLN